jgi:hypothetical protein
VSTKKGRWGILRGIKKENVQLDAEKKFARGNEKEKKNHQQADISPVAFEYWTGMCSVIGTKPKSGETAPRLISKMNFETSIPQNRRPPSRLRKGGMICGGKKLRTAYSQRVISVSPLL